MKGVVGVVHTRVRTVVLELVTCTHPFKGAE